MNYTRNCIGSELNGNCWHKSGIVKPSNYYSPSYETGAVLNNGELITFGHYSTTCENMSWGQPVCGAIFIDTNGFKGSNYVCKDIFRIFIRVDNIYAIDGCGTSWLYN